jgi:hypothetical protein
MEMTGSSRVILGFSLPSWIRYLRKTAELFGFVLHDRLMVFVHLILSGNDVPGRSHSFIPGIRDSLSQSQGHYVPGKL